MVSELGTRYKTADAERLDLKRLVADAQSSRIQLGDALNKHKTLEDAHLVQSKFIHKLQKKLSKVDTYTETIEMQEKVIMKMQSVIDSGAPERNKKMKMKIENEKSNLDSPEKKKKLENNENNEIREEFQNRVNELLLEVSIFFCCVD